VRRRSAPRIGDFERLYRDRYARFLRVAEGITDDVETARDAVQEGFARAIRAREGYRGDGPLENWVWSCVVNAARQARLRANLPLSEELAEAPRPPAQSTALLDSLPDRQRLVVFLRYYADLEYAAIADVLGIAVGTVGATLNKAHAALRRRLEEVQRT
jgi:RNA polymerase sigma-70 factor, ECF subfamily